jgi:hypothetical protein
MQFNSETNNQDLISDITFRLGSGIDLNNYTLKDRTRNINTRLGLAWHSIFESYGGWKFMDDNQSDVSSGLPYADQTITSGTGLYSIPSAALVIDTIEVKYQSAGVLTKIYPLTHEQFIERGGDAAFSSNGTPIYYMLQGDVIRLLPTPNYTLATAMRVYFQKTMTAFATSDTTATPGFASIFHPILSIGAALDYADPRLPAKVAGLTRAWSEMESRMRSFYAKRWRDRQPNRIYSGTDIVDENS